MHVGKFLWCDSFFTHSQESLQNYYLYQIIPSERFSHKALTVSLSLVFTLKLRLIEQTRRRLSPSLQGRLHRPFCRTQSVLQERHWFGAGPRHFLHEEWHLEKHGIDMILFIYCTAVCSIFYTVYLCIIHSSLQGTCVA